MTALLPAREPDANRLRPTDVANRRLVPLLVLVCLMAGVVGCHTTAEPSGAVSASPPVTTTAPTPSGSPADPGHDGEAAVWSVAPGQNLQPSTRTFTALVTRLDCNSGVTGDVLPPEVRADGSRIVVTFLVTPKRADAARCPANDQVRFEVDLGEALQRRSLVDGHCLPGQPGVRTVFCLPDGVRFTP